MVRGKRVRKCATDTTPPTFEVLVGQASALLRRFAALLTAYPAHGGICDDVLAWQERLAARRKFTRVVVEVHAVEIEEAFDDVVDSQVDDGDG